VEEVGEEEPDQKAQARGEKFEEEADAESEAQERKLYFLCGGERSFVDDLSVFPDIHPLVGESEGEAGPEEIGEGEEPLEGEGGVGESEDGGNPGGGGDDEERAGEDELLHPPGFDGDIRRNLPARRSVDPHPLQDAAG
jgi:hypothetical protein